MALIIYPTVGADSFISVADADVVIANNSLQSEQWIALTEPIKEVYLRIAFTRIMQAIAHTDEGEGYLDEATYDPLISCLPDANALMAIHDLSYGLSSDINPNTGLISKEKVGSLEVTYFHGNPMHQVSSRKTSYYPSSVVPCINGYGGNVTSANNLMQMTLGHS